MKMKLLIILLFSCSLLLIGFDKSEEKEISLTVKSMITSINEKDAEGYIQTLNDYFIKATYGDKDFIRGNVGNFGHVDLLEFDVMAIKTYISYAHYKLIHTNNNDEKTTFCGEIILEKTKEGWKIYSISEHSDCR